MAEEKRIHRRGSYGACTAARVGRHARVAGRGRAIVLGMAFLLMAAGARAQSACDLLKASLAARLPPDPRSYQLDAVPAATPVPPGAKVIGTCEGGAKKILFSRVTAGAPAAAKASAPAPAPAPSPAPATVVLPEKPRQVPSGKADSAAAAVSLPASRPMPPVSPLPILESKPALGAGAAVAAPAGGEAAAGLSVQRVEAVVAPREDGSLMKRSARFAANHWPWLLVMVLLPLGLAAWAWVSHHRAYDEAGLPRGPRL